MSFSSIRFAIYTQGYLVGLPFEGYAVDNLSISTSDTGTISKTTTTYTIAYSGTETTLQSIDFVFKTNSSIYDSVTGYKILAPASSSNKYTFSNINADYYNLSSSDIKNDILLFSKSYTQTTLIGHRVSIQFYPTKLMDWLNKQYSDRSGIAYIPIVFGNDSYTPTTETHTINYNTATNCTFTTKPTSYTDGETLSIRAVANTGYHFSAHPYIKYTDTDGNEKTINFSTLNSTTEIFGSAISDIGTDSTIEVYATAEKDTTYYSYSETLANCTSNFADTTIAEGAHTITLTASEHYVFNSAPTVTGGTIEATISTDKSTCTCAVTVTGDFTLTASAEIAVYSYSEALENCTGDFAFDTIEYGEHTITLTASEHYYFSDTPTVTGGSITATISTDKKTCTCAVTVTGDFTLTASATAETSYTIAVTSSNATVEGVPSVYYEGETLNLTATTESGYYWSDAPHIQYNTLYGETITRNFTIDSTDNTKATFTGSLTQLHTTRANITVIANGTPATTYVDSYGAIYVYNVTVDNLHGFANHRWIIKTDDSGNETLIDLGDYVSALFRLYCDIGNTGDSTLKVQNYDLSEIAVKVPYNDVVTVDCGTVTIEGVNNSATDYTGELKFMLPFIGMQTVDISTALNHVLHLYYSVNVVTGEAVAILEIDGIKTNFWDCNLSQKFLYLSETDKQLSDYEFKSKFLYGFTPYVLYTYTLGENNAPAQNASIRKQVKDCTGYFTMSDCTAFATDNMNETERAKIIELLGAGCFYGKGFDDETILGA